VARLEHDDLPFEHMGQCQEYRARVLLLVAVQDAPHDVEPEVSFSRWNRSSSSGLLMTAPPFQDLGRLPQLQLRLTTPSCAW
jgi:hypothetical protein